MNGRQRGFNLMELMIVVAIAGILLALAVPGLTATIRNNRLASQTNEFIYTLKFARAEAIKRILPVTVCRSSTQLACNTLSTGWEGGWIAFVESAGNIGTLDAGEVIAVSHEALAGRSTLRGNNNYTNRITFNGQGMMQGGLVGHFVLCDSRGGSLALGDSRGIIVSFSGQTRLRTPTERARTGIDPEDPTTCAP